MIPLLTSLCFREAGSFPDIHRPRPRIALGWGRFLWATLQRLLPFAPAGGAGADSVPAGRAGRAFEPGKTGPVGVSFAGKRPDTLGETAGGADNSGKDDSRAQAAYNADFRGRPVRAGPTEGNARNVGVGLPAEMD